MKNFLYAERTKGASRFSAELLHVSLAADMPTARIEVIRGANRILGEDGLSDTGHCIFVKTRRSTVCHYKKKPMRNRLKPHRLLRQRTTEE